MLARTFPAGNSLSTAKGHQTGAFSPLSLCWRRSLEKESSCLLIKCPSSEVSWVGERKEILSEFSRLVLLRALPTQGQSKGVTIESLDLCALPLTAAAALAPVRIRYLTSLYPKFPAS